MPGIERIQRAERHRERTAVIDPHGAYSYGQLLESSARFAALLLAGQEDLAEKRVAFMVPPGFDYVTVQWGIWRAGGVAVPLGLMHPLPELEYVIDDARVTAIVVSPEFADKLRPSAESRGLRLLLATEAARADTGALPEIASARRAMILYTSGTTGKPKGVVTTHDNIQAQAQTLVEAWGWTAADHVLHVLPLHHIHGIINVLTCALLAGATCEFLPRFDAEATWARLERGGLTLFMAVPTIYARLIDCWDEADPARQRAMSDACRTLRLMVSGSAALPVSTFEKWRRLSGHALLERYGMTEIGMALSNPLEGERVPGSVGGPLPRVEVRCVDESGRPVPAGVPGELEVRGPGVFLEYWGRSEETQRSFRDGWFRTGDVVAVERGLYRILGRNSVDIIKTGGYKVSALEIEEVLRTHPDILECAVVGIEDREWGERVSAAVIPRAGSRLSLEALRSWAKERLAVYKIPSRLLLLEALPRNAMGKVQKPAVTALFTPAGGTGN